MVSPKVAYWSPYSLIYINDITNVDKDIHLIMYADDTSLFFCDVDADNLITEGNVMYSKFARLMERKPKQFYFYQTINKVP